MQLQQVLINLIMNSVEAMRGSAERPRKLSIKSAGDAEGVLVQVQDSGPGIEPELADRIFEPFFTTKPEGIGMGLSISRSIVESHGGRLWAVAVSGGALFEFTLPPKIELRLLLVFHARSGTHRFVVDDDPSVRRAIKRLIGSVGLQVELFGSAQEFLQAAHSDVPSCLVLDIRLPGISGLDFQRELAAANIHIPIIFISAHGDIPMTVRAMKAGAVEFLTKPFRDQDLLDAIQVGLERDRTRRQQEAELATLRKRLETLTPREREVLPLVVSGLLNKQIAAEIGTSETTVKVHRSQLMRKMGANSLAELVRLAERIGIPEKQP